MAFRGEKAFDAFAKAEMDDILKRDAEDDEKLAAGISMAVQKGVLEANPEGLVWIQDHVGDVIVDARAVER